MSNYSLSLSIFPGTSDDSSMQQYIIQAAVYIANLFFLTSDTTVSIVKDTELNDEDAGRIHVKEYMYFYYKNTPM